MSSEESRFFDDASGEEGCRAGRAADSELLLHEALPGGAEEEIDEAVGQSRALLGRRGEGEVARDDEEGFRPWLAEDESETGRQGFDDGHRCPAEEDRNDLRFRMEMPREGELDFDAVFLEVRYVVDLVEGAAVHEVADGTRVHLESAEGGVEALRFGKSNRGFGGAVTGGDDHDPRDLPAEGGPPGASREIAGVFDARVRGEYGGARLGSGGGLGYERFDGAG